MDITETLALIFTDQFIANLILPINKAYIFNSVLLLNQEIIFKAFIVAFAGSFLGSVVNYGFGRFFSNAFIKFKKGKISDPKYRKFYYFLLLTPFSFAGTLVTFLAGFGHMRFHLFALISFCAHLVYMLLSLI